MSRLVLYSTDCCHLCDQAIALIEPIATELKVTVEIIDITDSSDLVNKYGLTIPVLSSSETNIELNWPFDSTDVEKYLSSTV